MDVCAPSNDRRGYTKEGKISRKVHFTSGVHNFFHQYNLHHVLVKELGPLEIIFHFLANTGLITINFFEATKTFRGGGGGLFISLFEFFTCICHSIVRVLLEVISSFWYAHTDS